MNKKRANLGRYGFNICLMGASLNTGNRGVSALCASLVKTIRDVRPEAKITLLVGNRDAQPQELQLASGKVLLSVANYRLSPKAALHEHLLWILFMACIHRIVPIKRFRQKLIHANSFLRTLYYADLIGEIRGGDSFSDIYGLRRLAIGVTGAIVSLLMQKRLILLPQTYGPFNTLMGKIIAKFIMSRSDRIFSRDKAGCNFLRRLLGKGHCEDKVMFCPDVAFMLDSLPPNLANIHPPVDNSIHPSLVGFNVNGLMYNGGYTRDNMFGLKFDYRIFTIKLMEALLKETDAHILLVPHTFGPPGNINSDHDACRELLNATKGDDYHNRVHMVMQEYDQSELKGIIGACDFFVGSRMHACIAALSQGIPTLGVAYSQKFLGVFDSIGVGHMVVDARKVDEKTAINTVLQCFERRSAISLDVKSSVASAQTIIKSVFEKLILEGF